LLAVVLLVLGVRAAIGLQEPPPTLVLTGHVDVATGADGKLLVLIDLDTPTQPADRVVDHVFRLQNAALVNYSGEATVTYVRGRLTVQVGTDSGWAFTVTGRPLPPPDTPLVDYKVSGIAHMWGAAIRQSPETLFSTLSLSSCTKTAGGTLSGGGGDPSCKNCQTGGPGVQGCSMNCGGGNSCSADCDEDLYACCNCPSGCGCCGGGIENGSAHH
jgi:hypothetical protein